MDIRARRGDARILSRGVGGSKMFWRRDQGHREVFAML